MNRVLAVSCVVAVALVACGGGDPQTPDQYEFGGNRSVFLEVPTTYDHSQPTPLLIVLHGFGANAFLQLRYTGLDKLIEEQGVLLAAPEGTEGQDGKQFWNATDWCCDNFGTGVDDVAYITGLIDEISGVWNVDPKRVFLFGHSNGGFMSYRMACDRADRVAAIVSLAGGTWLDDSKCQPSEPVSVLQIHGDADETVLYEGGAGYPSAQRSTELWAAHDGCSTSRTAGTSKLDLVDTLAGEDTTVDVYEGCDAGKDVQLWTIEGGSHIPVVTDDFRAQLWAWLMAHAKA